MSNSEFCKAICPPSKTGLSGSVCDWCSEHWFLTFLLMSSVIGVVGSVASNALNKSGTTSISL